ncbi:MAG: 50S ribosomal protein L24 [Prevotellaceae bacterium]|jgi:large subunit ribosomal protein L24|nr:50S ribosomal protein L24 [Prevotellaceae bacterium]
MSKLHVKKGDNVIVTIAGHDKKNGQWQPHRVLSVDVKKQKAIVEGVNMVSKSTKPNAKNPQGGIVKQEAPIHISNLMLVDPKTGAPTRIGRRLNEKGELVRYAKKSGEEIK